MLRSGTLAALVIAATVAGVAHLAGAVAPPELARSLVPGVAQSDKACEQCHADIYRRYLQTAMANGSGDALSAFIPGEFTHTASGIHYALVERGGQPWLEYSRPGTALRGERQLELFVGSGHRGRTYLFQTEGWWFEMPVNYYSRTGGYEMAPNWQNLKEMPLASPVDSGCLHCHASAVQVEEPGSMNKFASLPFLQGGITCESCHGNATDHVLSGGKAAVLNPDKLAPDRRDAICYRCHLEGRTNVMQPGKSQAEFRPGDSLEEYVTYFVHRGAPNAMKRSVSEVESFNLSKCRQASGDRMSCTTCHDPHSDPSAAERVSYYRARCTSCHSQEKFVSLTVAHAHHPEQRDCTVCHMPSVENADVAHSQTTDHRIPRRPGMYDPLPAEFSAELEEDSEPLVPVPGTTASERDLAVATFNLIANGDRNARAQAQSLLQAAYKHSPEDAQVLADLGWLAVSEGDRMKAAKYFSESLRLKPDDREAATDLGVLFAKAGHFPEAAAAWQPVFDRNPFIPELGLDLATIRCAEGRKKEAIATLDRLLLFSPDNGAAQKLRAKLEAPEYVCGR